MWGPGREALKPGEGREGMQLSDPTAAYFLSLWPRLQEGSLLRPDS